MKNVDIAKKNFNAGYWTKGNLRALVAKGRLTQDEMDSITGGGQKATSSDAKGV